jgi:hypothetical protein
VSLAAPVRTFAPLVNFPQLTNIVPAVSLYLDTFAEDLTAEKPNGLPSRHYVRPSISFHSNSPQCIQGFAGLQSSVNHPESGFHTSFFSLSQSYCCIWSSIFEGVLLFTI